MIKLFSFLKNNPVILISVFIVLAFGALLWRNDNLENKNKVLTEQVKVFVMDTTARGRAQMICQEEKMVYLTQLVDVNETLDSLKTLALKLNPGLVYQFPSIDALKRKRK
ncbi:hypothetical protein [Dyadobacter sp. CY312]|uniref:hypothetical protein n=1 Tax=Dyadobacter sp. CY312 TaxID=2907303 RepID=UPI001F2238DB|nr:hypothetical protein [Dyadobacter sp. CY312]MCE7039253.1 hypothetical protein [Dyadobacter sp. CY312]